MDTNKQRETEETLIKFNLQSVTEQEADQVADRVMKRLCNASNDTLRDVCLLIAGRIVEMTCRPCQEHTFSAAAFGLLEGFLDEVKQAAIQYGALHDGVGNA